MESELEIDWKTSRIISMSWVGGMSLTRFSTSDAERMCSDMFCSDLSCWMCDGGGLMQVMGVATSHDYVGSLGLRTSALELGKNMSRHLLSSSSV